MPDEMMRECPFCGGEPELRDPHGAFSRLAAVFCNDCEIRGPLAARPNEAIAAWNTRHPPAPLMSEDEQRWPRYGDNPELEQALVSELNQQGGSDEVPGIYWFYGHQIDVPALARAAISSIQSEPQNGEG